jgi:hypothetical protein
VRRILAILVFSFLTSLAALCESPRAVRIPRVHRAPKLQDFIDGTPREAEVAISDFVQFDPVDGAPITQPTTAYLSYDERNLYVGWICKDDPKKVRARIARRKDIFSDDRVTINLDTFLDHKHAYWFDVNPYGVQFDGRTTDGQGDDDTWESLWYSEGRFTEDGYVVLETIPFRSLRFPNGVTQHWGFCLARFIQRNNEMSIWPAVSRKGLPQFVGQYAELEIPEDISPGRNMQFIPYGMFSGSRFLDPTRGFRRANDQRMGLDSKVVIKDAFTLDTAINPDFSQVESDEPQVTVNQRDEVVYPERRPFFMENASLFKLPEQLFFSRRIVDPQFGVRLTGTVGRWNLGFLVADDRAPGKRLESTDSHFGERALDEVVRVEHEFGRQSHVGAMVTNTNFAGTYNRVGGLDARIALGGNWNAIGIVATSTTRNADGTHVDGQDIHGGVTANGPHSYIESGFLNRSPGFLPALGYVDRVDIRKWSNYGEYRWRPKDSKFVAYGPSLSQALAWDFKGQMAGWYVEPSFTFEMRRLTSFRLSHHERYELFQNIGFRRNGSEFKFNSEPLKWLALNGDLAFGRAINYYPGNGLQPFSATFVNVSGGATVRPRPQLRIDQTYLYSRLGAEKEWLPAGVAPTSGAIFNDHILRTKANYQFSRSLSLRAIVDYHGVLPNTSLVSLEKNKRVGADLLLTYLLHPGTALYAGYSDGYENVAWNAGTNTLQRRDFPGTSTGRQVFVKVSYLFRY